VLIGGTTNPAFVLIGSALILTAVGVSAIAYRINGLLKHEQLARAGLAKSTRRPNPLKGIVIAMVGGLLMGAIGGLLARARDGEIGLGPYAAAALFAAGVFFSTFPFNIFFLNLPIEGQPLEIGAYFQGRLAQHAAGWFAGIVWFAGMACGMIAAAAPANLEPSMLVRILTSQGAPIVGALLGIVAWRELKGGDVRVKILAVLMLVLFAVGLTMIGLSPSSVRK